MPTSKQLAKRRNHIGASDVGAIIGVDPFRSAADVWVSKVYGDTFEGNEATELGNMVEGGMLEWFKNLHGKRIRRNVERKVPWDTPVVVHADALVIDDQDPVEVKSAGLLGPLRAGWGDAQTGEVPQRVEAQCLTQMAAFSAQRCHVPALLGGRGRVLFEVQWNEEVVDYIRIEVERFWQDFVLTKTPPPDSVPALSVLTGIDRTEDEIDLPEEAIALVDEYQAHAKTYGQIRKIKEATKAEVLHLLGNAEAGRMPDGRVVTFRMRHRKATAACDYRAIGINKAPLALPGPEDSTDE